MQPMPGQGLLAWFLLFGGSLADYHSVHCDSLTIHSQADFNTTVGEKGCQVIDQDVVLASDATGDISLDGIDVIEGSLRCEDGSQVTALRHEGIWDIYGDLILRDMPKLQTVDFKNLLQMGDRYGTPTGGKVVLEDLPAGSSIDLSELAKLSEFHAVDLPRLNVLSHKRYTPSLRRQHRRGPQHRPLGPGSRIAARRWRQYAKRRTAHSQRLPHRPRVGPQEARERRQRGQHGHRPAQQLHRAPEPSPWTATRPSWSIPSRASGAHRCPACASSGSAAARPTSTSSSSATAACPRPSALTASAVSTCRAVRTLRGSRPTSSITPSSTVPRPRRGRWCCATCRACTCTRTRRTAIGGQQGRGGEGGVNSHGHDEWVDGCCRTGGLEEDWHHTNSRHDRCMADFETVVLEENITNNFFEDFLFAFWGRGGGNFATFWHEDQAIGSPIDIRKHGRVTERFEVTSTDMGFNCTAMDEMRGVGLFPGVYSYNWRTAPVRRDA
ncbi:hypothetical protein PG997_014188 [Apiospora hydei]|uniref:Uncharacterized protein n=1 Tax=Apiospora hydei TaxID=1337664 RepID=A0ABR1UVI9_9PEZI